MISLQYSISIPVVNFFTNETWLMTSIDESVGVDETDLERIEVICNEPLVYQWLFKEKLKGERYTLEKAREFIEWVKLGWSTQKYFVFLIRDTEGIIQAAIDIKSPNLEAAEIGYWASSDKPGIMSNAVKALCNLARKIGYHQLYADVQVDNIKSKRVIQRAGFHHSKELRKNDSKYVRYINDFIY